MSRKTALKGIPFKYQAPEAISVSLAGSFNGWNVSAHPLKKNKDGIWSTVVKLFPGTYEYLYVIDDEWWRDDPNCEIHQYNRYGGHNCLLIVEE